MRQIEFTILAEQEQSGLSSADEDIPYPDRRQPPLNESGIYDTVIMVMRDLAGAYA